MTDRQSSRDDQLFVRSIGQLAQLLNRSERAAARTLNCHGLGKKCDDDETGRIVTFYMANARENQVNESVNGNYSILTERLEIKLDVYGEQKKGFYETSNQTCTDRVGKYCNWRVRSRTGRVELLSAVDRTMKLARGLPAV